MMKILNKIKNIYKLTNLNFKEKLSFKTPIY